MTSKHLYVHIPFCRSRCAYCDFASEPVGPHARAGRVEGYLEALRAELAAAASAAASPDGPVETIYVGGGTPTALPGEALVALARELAALQGGAPDAASGARSTRARPRRVPIPSSP